MNPRTLSPYSCDPLNRNTTYIYIIYIYKVCVNIVSGACWLSNHQTKSLVWLVRPSQKWEINCVCVYIYIYIYIYIYNDSHMIRLRLDNKNCYIYKDFLALCLQQDRETIIRVVCLAYIVITQVIIISQLLCLWKRRCNILGLSK